MNQEKGVETVPARAEKLDARSELGNSRSRAAESRRSADYRTAIEASTARLLTIAFTRALADSDPEAS